MVLHPVHQILHPSLSLAHSAIYPGRSWMQHCHLETVLEWFTALSSWDSIGVIYSTVILRQYWSDLQHLSSWDSIGVIYSTVILRQYWSDLQHCHLETVLEWFTALSSWDSIGVIYSTCHLETVLEWFTALSSWDSIGVIYSTVILRQYWSDLQHCHLETVLEWFTALSSWDSIGVIYSTVILRQYWSDLQHCHLETVLEWFTALSSWDSIGVIYSTVILRQYWSDLQHCHLETVLEWFTALSSWDSIGVIYSTVILRQYWSDLQHCHLDRSWTIIKYMYMYLLADKTLYGVNIFFLLRHLTIGWYNFLVVCHCHSHIDKIVSLLKNTLYNDIYLCRVSSLFIAASLSYWVKIMFIEVVACFSAPLKVYVINFMLLITVYPFSCIDCCHSFAFVLAL